MFFITCSGDHRDLHSFPTRRSSDLGPCLAMLTAMMTSAVIPWGSKVELFGRTIALQIADINIGILYVFGVRSEEHTSELQSRRDLVCRLLLEKKKKKQPL